MSGVAAAVAPASRWLGISAVEARLGLSRCTIWRRLKEGKFPRPSYFGQRRAWLESDIDAWAAAQPKERPA